MNQPESDMSRLIQWLHAQGGVLEQRTEQWRRICADNTVAYHKILFGIFVETLEDDGNFYLCLVNLGDQDTHNGYKQAIRDRLAWESRTVTELTPAYPMLSDLANKLKVQEEAYSAYDWSSDPVGLLLSQHRNTTIIPQIQELLLQHKELQEASLFYVQQAFNGLLGNNLP